MPKSRKHLLKFSGPTEYALQNLEDGVIFCQHYSAYNDPFEFWNNVHEGIPDPKFDPERYLAAAKAWGFPASSIDELMAIDIFSENVEDYFHECQHYAPPFAAMRQEMRIACFGSNRDNLLLWSHYGDGLRGFCIVFNEDLIASVEQNSYLLDVAYVEEPPIVDSLVYGIARDQDWYSHTAIDETKVMIECQGMKERQADIPMYEETGAEALRMMRDIWQRAFGTKPAEWNYERERRLLVQTESTDNAPVFRNYPREAIKEIILGELMADEYRTRVLAIMKKHYPNSRIKNARRARDCYSLVID